MKTIIFTISLVIFLILCNTALTQITFEKTYGGLNHEFGYSVQQTNDNGYIITGITAGDVYLIKTDENGDYLWAKIYGGSDIDYGCSVQQTNDNGYIICGYTKSFGSGWFDFYLIKTDSNGDSLWTKTYGGTSFDYGYSVQQTNDSGYIITGWTQSFGNGIDIYLIKTDENGITLWTHTYGGTSNEYGYSVQQTNDDGYIIAGTTTSFGVGSSDVYLIKTDSNGDTLWTQTYGGSDIDYGYSVQQTNDGGYIICGETESFSLDRSVYLIKTDENGITLWTNIYHDCSVSYYGHSVQQTNDNGYIITGDTTSFGVQNVYLIKTDSNGNNLWTRTYGGPAVDYGHSIQQTNDGGYIITGSTQNFGAEYNDVYLIKTDSNGCVIYPIFNLGNDTTICTYETINLNANLGAGYNYLWNDGSMSQHLTIDGSVIGIGEHTYYVEVTNKNGCSSSDTIIINIDACTYIEIGISQTIIKIYPNPANDRLNLEINMVEESILLKIVDLYGKEIYSEHFKDIHGKLVRKIDLSIYSKGIYFLKACSGDTVKVQKLVIQ